MCSHMTHMTGREEGVVERTLGQVLHCAGPGRQAWWYVVSTPSTGDWGLASTFAALWADHVVSTLSRTAFLGNAHCHFTQVQLQHKSH